MLKRFWKRLDAFEDTPAAAVLGIAILALVTFAMLLAPVGSIGGAP